jgi:hypothetical protein
MISWKGFTARAEISVITDSALKADPVDVALGRLILAEGTVTENAVVDFMLTSGLADSVVNLNEPMARVVLRCSQNAVGTKVPIRAGQTLVANTNDTLDDVSRVFLAGWISTYLVTAITDSGVAELPAREAARCDQILQAEVTVRSEVEGVTRVVAMLVSKETAEAKIVIFAVIAAYEIALVCFCLLSAREVSDKREENIPRQHPLQMGLSSP